MLEINKIYCGDCLELMKEIPNKSINLIYIDPPFGIKQDDHFNNNNYNLANFDKINSVDEILNIKLLSIREQRLLRYLYPRLKLMRELLSEQGSIYVHLDWHIGHYIKVIMDEIFGKENFVNSITWKRSSGVTGVSGGMKNYARLQDNILFYRKSKEVIFNQQFTPYSENTLKMYKYDDNYGKGKYRLQILRNYSEDSIQKMIKEGKIYIDVSGKRHLKQYLGEKEGVIMSDIWDDIPQIQHSSYEKLGYDTQKPQELLKRIIEASSNKNSIVADFFCGSGTTLAVAEKLCRKWIGVDISPQACKIANHRIRQISSLNKWLNYAEAK